MNAVPLPQSSIAIKTNSQSVIRPREPYRVLFAARTGPQPPSRARAWTTSSPTIARPSAPAPGSLHPTPSAAAMAGLRAGVRPPLGRGSPLRQVWNPAPSPRPRAKPGPRPHPGPRHPQPDVMPHRPDASPPAHVRAKAPSPSPPRNRCGNAPAPEARLREHDRPHLPSAAPVRPRPCVATVPHLHPTWTGREAPSPLGAIRPQRLGPLAPQYGPPLQAAVHGQPPLLAPRAAGRKSNAPSPACARQPQVHAAQPGCRAQEAGSLDASPRPRAGRPRA